MIEVSFSKGNNLILQGERILLQTGVSSGRIEMGGRT